MAVLSYRFETLDAIRGIAAMMVISRHTELFGTAGAESHSYLAVDLFFMLSGFVIAHAYERHLRSGALTPLRFVAIRLVRLYPMFLLAVCLATFVALTRPEFEPNVLSKWTSPHSSALEILGSAALTLFFLPSRLGDSVLLFPLNTAFWSLMFEVVVNILYACVYGKLTLKVLWGVVIATGLCLGVVALRRNGLEMGWSWSISSLVYGSIRATFGFMAGVLLLRLFSARGPINSNVRAVLMLGLVAIPLALPDSGRLNGLIDAIAVLAFFPFAIAIGAPLHAHGALLRYFMWLGAASYPVYVLHVPSLILFERYVHQSGIGARPPLALFLPAFFLLALVVTATWLDRHYDQRVRKWIIDRFDLRPNAALRTADTRSATQIQAELSAYDRVLAAQAEQSAPPADTLTPDQNSRPAPSAKTS